RHDAPFPAGDGSAVAGQQDAAAVLDEYAVPRLPAGVAGTVVGTGQDPGPDPNRALYTVDQADQDSGGHDALGAAGEDRQEVVAHRTPLRGPPAGAEHQRLSDIAPFDRGGVGHRQLPGPAAAPVQQPSEDAGAVEAGRAQPLHRTVRGDECGGAAVGQHRILTDRWKFRRVHGRHSDGTCLSNRPVGKYCSPLTWRTAALSELWWACPWRSTVRGCPEDTRSGTADRTTVTERARRPGSGAARTGRSRWILHGAQWPERASSTSPASRAVRASPAGASGGSCSWEEGEPYVVMGASRLLRGPFGRVDVRDRCAGRMFRLSPPPARKPVA